MQLAEPVVGGAAAVLPVGGAGRARTVAAKAMMASVNFMFCCKVFEGRNGVFQERVIFISLDSLKRERKTRG